MKLIHIYNSTTGLFESDELIKPDSRGKYTIPSNATDVQPTGFHRPSWDGVKWVETEQPMIVSAQKAALAYQIRNEITLKDISTLEQSIDTSRIRREVFEGMRKKLAGLSPTAAEAWSIAKVQDVDNQIGVLRAKLK